MLRSKVGQGHWGQKKTKKCGILFQSHPLGHGPSAAFFFGSSPRGLGPLRRWENQHMLSSWLLQSYLQFRISVQTLTFLQFEITLLFGCDLRTCFCVCCCQQRPIRTLQVASDCCSRVWITSQRSTSSQSMSVLLHREIIDYVVSLMNILNSWMAYILGLTLEAAS